MSLSTAPSSREQAFLTTEQLLARVLRPGYQTSEFLVGLVTSIVGVLVSLGTIFHVSALANLTPANRSFIIIFMTVAIGVVWAYFIQSRAGIKLAALAPHVVGAVKDIEVQAKRDSVYEAGAAVLATFQDHLSPKLETLIEAVHGLVDVVGPAVDNSASQTTPAAAPDPAPAPQPAPQPAAPTAVKLQGVEIGSIDENGNLTLATLKGEPVASGDDAPSSADNPPSAPDASPAATLAASAAAPPASTAVSDSTASSAVSPPAT